MKHKEEAGKKMPWRTLVRIIAHLLLQEMEWKAILLYLWDVLTRYRRHFLKKRMICLSSVA